MSAEAELPAVRRAHRWRLLVVQGLQLPAIGLVLVAPGPAALWTAGLYGSAVCCAGTDSGWRWRTRLLVAQAVAWLLVPLVFALG